MRSRLQLPLCSASTLKPSSRNIPANGCPVYTSDQLLLHSDEIKAPREAFLLFFAPMVKKARDAYGRFGGPTELVRGSSIFVGRKKN